jgi:hypothetical protein
MQNLYWENFCSYNSKTLKIYYYQLLLLMIIITGKCTYNVNIKAHSDSCTLMCLLNVHCPDSNTLILKRNFQFSHTLLTHSTYCNSWMKTKIAFAHSRPTIYNETKQITQNNLLSNFSMFVHLIIDMIVSVSPPHCLPCKCHLCSAILCLDCSPFLLPPWVCPISCNTNLVHSTTFGKMWQNLFWFSLHCVSTHKI